MACFAFQSWMDALILVAIDAKLLSADDVPGRRKLAELCVPTYLTYVGRCEHESPRTISKTIDLERTEA